MAVKKEMQGSKAESQMVEVYLFKDSGKYKDDVFVGINGKRYVIQRGKKVLVPRAVAEVLQNSLDQDSFTADYIDAKQAEYKAAERHIG